MSLDYDNIDQIDSRTKCLIYGYSRKTLQNLPDFIMSTCLLFYYSIETNETEKFTLLPETNEKYREQLKSMQDHLALLRDSIQEKENIIEDLMLRYDLGIIFQDRNRGGPNLSSQEINDAVITEELRRKCEAFTRKTFLENFELKEIENELRDENFAKRNDILDMQDDINRRVLKIHKLDKSATLRRNEGKVKENEKVEIDQSEMKQTDEMVMNISPEHLSNYMNWNVDQIIIWIQYLENGRYKKYVDILTNGFIKSEINGGDLVDITCSDLSSPPFNIENIRDKTDLVKHFKSLSEALEVDEDHIEFPQLSHVVL